VDRVVAAGNVNKPRIHREGGRIDALRGLDSRDVLVRLAGQKGEFGTAEAHACVIGRQGDGADIWEDSVLQRR
jgi:hypothetical protein